MYKSMLQGKTLAEQVANITADDVAAASKRAHLQQPPDYSNAAFKYLQTVSTACKLMGHSKEVAQDARKKYFAMIDYFGLPSLFFTISPCDECSFCVGLYATSKKQSLPSLNWSDAQCLAYFSLRKQYHLQSPGACSLEYQSIIQVLIETLIGWDPETNTEKKGIFGIPIASYGNGTPQNSPMRLFV